MMNTSAWKLTPLDWLRYCISIGNADMFRNEDDAEFYLLARKAVDVMQRRGWQINHHYTNRTWFFNVTQHPTILQCLAEMVAQDEAFAEQDKAKGGKP